MPQRAYVTSTLRHYCLFAWGASPTVSFAGHIWLTPRVEVTALMWLQSSRSNYPLICTEIANAEVSIGPGPRRCIKPSWSSKVSSYNEPCRRFHCANIPPTTQCAYWWQVVSACLCMYVMYVCMLVRPLPGKEQGNRVTLRLIRKLMHRKSRQRHCSPSARSAGENNLHIGRLMDTFIGSTDRGIEGERRKQRARKGEGS